MAYFESTHAYWTFAEYVKGQARHILDASSNRFLETVKSTSEKRRGVINVDTRLWRAQVGHTLRAPDAFEHEGSIVSLDERPFPWPIERMKPLSNRAVEGRVNAKGIPCLYLSTEKDTAIAETRPWIGSYVSVAEFAVLRDLNIVDCSIDVEAPRVYFLEDNAPPAQREKDVWWYINKAFSVPITREDDVADYAPTQILAESFRAYGYDGIVYGSLLGPGKTVAIFDLAAAEVANCALHRVHGVKLDCRYEMEQYISEKYATHLNTKERNLSVIVPYPAKD